MALLSVFIRDPQFQGQTKDRLASPGRRRLVETTIKDHFDHWLSGTRSAPGMLLERVVERAEERCAGARTRSSSRKTATRKLRLPGKLTDCAATRADGTEIFLVEGDSAGGSAKQARNRETQAILPLRGKILNVASASADKLKGNQEIADIAQALGCGTRGQFDAGQAALRAGHHHDRRRRRRRPHRLAADDLLLSRDARPDRGRGPVCSWPSRRSTA